MLTFSSAAEGKMFMKETVHILQNFPEIYSDLKLNTFLHLKKNSNQESRKMEQLKEPDFQMFSF